MKAVRGQKHLSKAKNGMKELIYLIKVFQQPQKPQSDFSHNLKVESYDFWGHQPPLFYLPNLTT